MSTYSRNTRLPPTTTKAKPNAPTRTPSLASTSPAALNKHRSKQDASQDLDWAATTLSSANNTTTLIPAPNNHNAFVPSTMFARSAVAVHTMEKHNTQDGDANGTVDGAANATASVNCADGPFPHAEQRCYIFGGCGVVDEDQQDDLGSDRVVTFSNDVYCLEQGVGGHQGSSKQHGVHSTGYSMIPIPVSTATPSPAPAIHAAACCDGSHLLVHGGIQDDGSISHTIHALPLHNDSPAWLDMTPKPAAPPPPTTESASISGHHKTAPSISGHFHIPAVLGLPCDEVGPGPALYGHSMVFLPKKSTIVLVGGGHRVSRSERAKREREDAKKSGSLPARYAANHEYDVLSVEGIRDYSEDLTGETDPIQAFSGPAIQPNEDVYCLSLDPSFMSNPTTTRNEFVVQDTQQLDTGDGSKFSRSDGAYGWTRFETARSPFAVQRLMNSSTKPRKETTGDAILNAGLCTSSAMPVLDDEAIIVADFSGKSQTSAGFCLQLLNLNTFIWAPIDCAVPIPRPPSARMGLQGTAFTVPGSGRLVVILPSAADSNDSSVSVYQSEPLATSPALHLLVNEFTSIQFDQTLNTSAIGGGVDPATHGTPRAHTSPELSARRKTLDGGQPTTSPASLSKASSVVFDHAGAIDNSTVEAQRVALEAEGHSKSSYEYRKLHVLPSRSVEADWTATSSSFRNFGCYGLVYKHGGPSTQSNAKRTHTGNDHVKVSMFCLGGEETYTDHVERLHTECKESLLSDLLQSQQHLQRSKTDNDTSMPMNLEMLLTESGKEVRRFYNDAPSLSFVCDARGTAMWNVEIERALEHAQHHSNAGGRRAKATSALQRRLLEMPSKQSGPKKQGGGGQHSVVHDPLAEVNAIAEIPMQLRCTDPLATPTDTPQDSDRTDRKQKKVKGKGLERQQDEELQKKQKQILKTIERQSKASHPSTRVAVLETSSSQSRTGGEYAKEFSPLRTVNVEGAWRPGQTTPQQVYDTASQQSLNNSSQQKRHVPVYKRDFRPASVGSPLLDGKGQQLKQPNWDLYYGMLKKSSGSAPRGVGLKRSTASRMIDTSNTVSERSFQSFSQHRTNIVQEEAPQWQTAQNLDVEDPIEQQTTAQRPFPTKLQEQRHRDNEGELMMYRRQVLNALLEDKLMVTKLRSNAMETDNAEALLKVLNDPADDDKQSKLAARKIGIRRSSLVSQQTPLSSSVTGRHRRRTSEASSTTRSGQTPTNQQLRPTSAASMMSQDSCLSQVSQGSVSISVRQAKALDLFEETLDEAIAEHVAELSAYSERCEAELRLQGITLDDDDDDANSPGKKKKHCKKKRHTHDDSDSDDVELVLGGKSMGLNPPKEERAALSPSKQEAFTESPTLANRPTPSQQKRMEQQVMAKRLALLEQSGSTSQLLEASVAKQGNACLLGDSVSSIPDYSAADASDTFPNTSSTTHVQHHPSKATKRRRELIRRIEEDSAALALQGVLRQRDAQKSITERREKRQRKKEDDAAKVLQCALRRRLSVEDITEKRTEKERTALEKKEQDQEDAAAVCLQGSLRQQQAQADVAARRKAKQQRDAARAEAVKQIAVLLANLEDVEEVAARAALHEDYTSAHTQLIVAEEEAKVDAIRLSEEDAAALKIQCAFRQQLAKQDVERRKAEKKRKSEAAKGGDAASSV